MRKYLWLVALALSLAATQQRADAQNLLTNTNRQTNASNTGISVPTSIFSTPFRLLDSFRSALSGGSSSSAPATTMPTYTSVPTPGSAEYFKAFGFKRLY